MRRSLELWLLVAVVAAASAIAASSGPARAADSPPVHVIAHVKPGASIAVYSRPFGRVVTRVGPTTEYDSPRALGVLATRGGRWLAVSLPELGNSRQGWIDASAGAVSYARTALELDVDLSQRMVVLRRGPAILRRMRVGVGRPGSSTPLGRFAVTDKLPGPAYGRFYGCCILALSATQPHLPVGWSGGNRIAIHGTPSSSDFGRAVSAGCVHASDRDLRLLMRLVPLGTPVVIRP
jgi:lipoprotein-anchoring transpeptidase ErfK/SrfK